MLITNASYIKFWRVVTYRAGVQHIEGGFVDYADAERYARRQQGNGYRIESITSYMEHH
jgi:hypothetical protein